MHIPFQPQPIHIKPNHPKTILALLSLFALALFLFFACQEKMDIQPLDIKTYKSFEEGRFQEKVFQKGKHSLLLAELQDQDKFPIKTKEQLLTFGAIPANREALAAHLDIHPSLLTQIIEEVDLMRCGLDVVTIQIMQNIRYQGQDIQLDGLFDIASFGSDTEQFESKEETVKIKKHIQAFPLDFDYVVPHETFFETAYRMAQSIHPIIIYDASKPLKSAKLNGEYEKTVFEHGKHIVILDQLKQQDKFPIQTKEQLLTFGAIPSNREKLAAFLDISPSLLTQIIEEVDLMRCGLDVITIQIMQNVRYRSQDIHMDGLFDVVALRSDPYKFESKEEVEKIKRYIDTSALEFDYLIPDEALLDAAFRKAGELMPLMAYYLGYLDHV